jgi:hypothetical protein
MLQQIRVQRMRPSFLLRGVSYVAVSALVACVDGRYVSIQIPGVYAARFDAIGRAWPRKCVLTGDSVSPQKRLRGATSVALGLFWRLTRMSVHGCAQPHVYAMLKTKHIHMDKGVSVNGS